MSLQQEFGKDINHIGCEFHRKQAIRRKLISYRLPIYHVTTIIGDKGYMEILCYIPIEEIIPEGIPYVRSLMHELEMQHPGSYDSFWKYFMKTWMSTYNPNTWNIYNILSRETEDEVIISRTDNPIERHNRSFQEE